MINNEEFRKYGHQLVDWMADYFENIEELPVKSQVKPNEVLNQLPDDAPVKGESMEHILKDFQEIIMPGMTHWQHPNFHAYFPANGSYPSLLAEMLMSTMGAQCMIWDTSPAAAELEEQVMKWIQKLSVIPEEWYGVIQDTASTATLASILTAREQVTRFQINQHGFDDRKLRIYCSTETHSSIEKAVKIAGIGSKNLVKIPCDKKAAMIPSLLEEAIEKDLEAGFLPTAVIVAIGTTGTLGIDPLDAIGDICQQHNVWLHVDAAYAGTAMLLPEYQWMIKGIEKADTYVFNPHKWMFTNFDCTAYYVKDRDALLNTFEILPEYLKTRTEGLVNNYRDWGIPLGRRFRALKLWFVIRNYGVEGIRNTLRNHISLANELSAAIEKQGNYRLITPTTLNVICFRYFDDSLSETALDRINEQIVHQINTSGDAYLTHTRFDGHYTMRLVLGQTYLRQTHVDKVWTVIQRCTEEVLEQQ